MPAPRNPIQDPRQRLLRDIGRASAAAASRDVAVDVRPLAAGFAGLAQGAAAAVAEQEHNERIAERVRTAKADTALRNEALRLFDAADPSDPEYEVKLSEGLDRLVRETVAGASFSRPETAELFTAEAQQLTGALLNQARDKRRVFLENEALTLWANHTDQLLNAIQVSPQDPTGVIKSFSAQTERLLQALPPAKRALALEQLQESAVLAAAEGRARKGQFKSALALLAPDKTPNLDPDKRANFERRIRELQNTAITDYLRSTQAAVAELEYRAIRGEATRADVEEAKRRGWFAHREPQYYDLLAQLDRAEAARLKAAEQEAKRLAEAEREAAGGGGSRGGSTAAKDGLDFDPDAATQATADKLLGRLFPEIAESGSPADLYAPSVDIGRRTGFLPSAFARHIRAGELASSPEELAAAAELVDKLEQDAPGLRTPAGERVAVTRELARTAFGGDYRRAAKFVTDQRLDPAGIEKRQQAFRTQVKGLTDELLSSKLADAFEAEQVPGAALAAFRDAQRAAFLVNGGDAAGSVDQAIAYMRQNGWGVTSVEGQPRLTQYPPEQFIRLPGFSATPKAARRLVEVEMKQFFTQLGMEPTEFRLETDEKTLADIRAGRTPTYAVAVRNKYGVYDRVMGPDLAEVRYAPPQASDVKQSRELSKAYDEFYVDLAAKAAKEATAAKDAWRQVFDTVPHRPELQDVP